MNRYRFNELSIGMMESFEVVITEDMMAKFNAITGDINPLHNNMDYAIEQGYKDKVVYGMLTAAFLSTLAGVYLPGEKSLIHSVETNFVKPVYVGDKLRVVGKIVEISDVVVKRIILKVVMFNQNSEKVLRGKMIIGVLDE